MANVQKLNNIDHAAVKIRQTTSARDHTMFAPVFLSEMRALQSNFPLLLFKDASANSLQPVALFGFEQGENLFIEQNQWTSQYIPMIVQRGPLMIGHEGESGADVEPTRVVAIDMDHPSVNHDEGEPLFLEFGGNSDYLERLATMLEAIHVGYEAIPHFIDALNRHGLISPVSFQITLNTGAEHTLEGFHTVDDEKLQTLSAEAVGDLQRQNFLFPAFMMVASLSQMKRLIGLKNAQAANQTG